MRKSQKNYFHALAVMVGYIIGVGMFGLPFLISQSGWFPFFAFAALLIPTQYLLHLMYANVILATENYHRFPGYVNHYFGKRARNFVFAAKMIGNVGALLAYIIITGIFLHQLLNPILGGSEFMYASVLFAIEAAIVFFGIGMIARAELIITIMLLIVVVMIMWKGTTEIDINNFIIVDWRYFLLPYGAMLFALDGNGSLPIVAKLLRRDPAAIKSVVRVGTFLSALIIVLFSISIAGISGPETTEDSLAGLKAVMGNGVVLLSLLFGVMTMVTSFFCVAEAVRETLWWDFKVNKHIAWAIAVFSPYILYLLGLKSLIGVISFAGAVSGGICAILLIMVFRRLYKRSGRQGLILLKHPLNRVVAYVLISMFVAGIIYETYFFILKLF